MIAALEAARRRGLIPGAASPAKDVAVATLSPMSPVVPNALGTREPARSRASPQSPLSPLKNGVNGDDAKGSEPCTDESDALRIAATARVYAMASWKRRIRHFGCSITDLIVRHATRSDARASRECGWRDSYFRERSV